MWNAEDSRWEMGPDFGLYSVKPSLVVSSDGNRIYMKMEEFLPEGSHVFFAYDLVTKRLIELADPPVEHRMPSCELIRWGKL